MSDKENRIIPRAKMPEGIDLCKKNITDFLKDAKLVIAEGRLSHAYISVQFALEEIGKILIFRDKMKNDPSDPLTITQREAFKFHPQKTQIVWELLGQEFEIIFDKGIDWQDKMWPKVMWLENTKAEYETRLDCAFVDFHAHIWHVGRNIEQEKLIRLINRIEEKLPQA